MAFTRRGTVSLSIDPDPATIFPDNPRIADRATASAINRAARGTRTEFDRAIRSRLALKQKFVRSLVEVRQVGGLGTKTKVQVVVNAGEKARDGKAARGEPKFGVPLRKYGSGGRQTRRGVKITVRRGRGPELIRGAFIAPVKSGARLVVMRANQRNLGIPMRRVRKVSPTTGRSYQSELPIFQRIGIPLTGMLLNERGVLDGVLAKGQDRLSDALRSQIRRFGLFRRRR